MTEGVKKGDALAPHGACGAELLGVCSFVGHNLQGRITTLSGWRDIALKGRRVFMTFDSHIVLKRHG